MDIAGPIVVVMIFFWMFGGRDFVESILRRRDQRLASKEQAALRAKEIDLEIAREERKKVEAELERYERRRIAERGATQPEVDSGHDTNTDPGPSGPLHKGESS